MRNCSHCFCCIKQDIEVARHLIIAFRASKNRHKKRECSLQMGYEEDCAGAGRASRSVRTQCHSVAAARVNGEGWAEDLVLMCDASQSRVCAGGKRCADQ